MILLLLVLSIGASGVFAQKTTVSLTSGGFPSVNGQKPTTPVSNSASAGQTLLANLNFGDISATAVSRRVSIKLPIRISATTNFKIEVQRVGTTAMGIKPSDIGFGIGNVRPQADGSKLLSNALSLNILQSFGTNPATAPVRGGVPSFESSLADISENPTVILTGSPTVKNEEHFGNDDGSILVDLTFVIVAQYFTPSDSENLSLIITVSPLP